MYSFVETVKRMVQGTETNIYVTSTDKRRYLTEVLACNERSDSWNAFVVIKVPIIFE